MHRGLLLWPAGVEVRLVFEDSVPAEFFEQVKQSWGALEPREFTVEAEKSADAAATVVVTTRTEHAVNENRSSPVPVVQLLDAARAQERLTVEVTLKVLQTLAGSMSLFHAAALADPESHSALVLIGPSGRGKTTASRFLGQHLLYLSDETAVVDPDLRVRPYAKPLSMIERQEQPKVQLNPAQLGLKVADPEDFSFQLKHVVILDRVAEPVQPRLLPVPLADALLEIVGQTSGLEQTEDGVRRLIELLQDCGGVSRLIYHEIVETKDTIESLLNGTLAPVVETEQIRYVNVPQSTSIDMSKVQRVPGTLGFVLGQRLLLFRQSQLYEVSEFAADCWLALEQPLESRQLKSALEEIYGDIPDEGFDAALQQLRQHSVVL